MGCGALTGGSYAESLSRDESHLPLHMRTQSVILNASEARSRKDLSNNFQTTSALSAKPVYLQLKAEEERRRPQHRPSQQVVHSVSGIPLNQTAISEEHSRRPSMNADSPPGRPLHLEVAQIASPDSHSRQPSKNDHSSTEHRPMHASGLHVAEEPPESNWRDRLEQKQDEAAPAKTTNYWGIAKESILDKQKREKAEPGPFHVNLPTNTDEIDDKALEKRKLKDQGPSTHAKFGLGKSQHVKGEEYLLLAFRDHDLSGFSTQQTDSARFMPQE